MLKARDNTQIKGNYVLHTITPLNFQEDKYLHSKKLNVAL